MLGTAQRMRTLLVLVGLLLAVPTTATAEHHVTWDFSAAVAIDYWTHEGITVPCQPTRYLMTDAESDHADDVYGGQVDMLTDPAACSIDISVTADAYRGSPDTDWVYCQDVVHEYGHLAGLPDDDAGGVMDLDASVVPFGCAHQRQWMVLQGWRKPPRWVRRSPRRVQRLWLQGHGYAAQTLRAKLVSRHAHVRRPPA